MYTFSSCTKLVLTCALLLICNSLSAQKAFKPVRAALKNAKYQEALKQITTLRNDTTGRYRDNERLCHYAIEANRGLNDEQNVKLYLKQPYDTIAFFSTTKAIVEEAVKADSIHRASIQGPDSLRPYKGFKGLQTEVKTHFPNIGVASRFHYDRHRWQDAMAFASCYVDLTDSATASRWGINAGLRKYNAALYTIAATQMGKQREAFKYPDLALQDTVMRALTLKSLALSALAEGDTAKYEHFLASGWETSKGRNPFFTRLADRYITTGRIADALRIAKVQARRDTTDALPLFAQCLAYLERADYDSCIAIGRKVTMLDSTQVDAYYFVGAAYAGKALVSKQCLQPAAADYAKQLERYRSELRGAQRWLEAYRVLAPDDADRWAPILYKVYLSLNDGRKFAEIEQIVKNLRNQKPKP